MNVPQTKTYFVALLCCFSLFLSAQNQGLSAIPAGMYFSAKKTIAEKTADSEHFRTLFAALKAADLEDVLDMNGPFTFFAPSEVAFNKMSKMELSELFKEENKSDLKELLTYHLVAGNYSASKILKAMCRGGGKASFTTIHGNKIIATMSGLDIVLTDALGNKAVITNADATQSNGVIHQIDQVIRPSK
ncbi:fasciclin domain-containing protein [Flavobacterium sp. ASW18X]|uniref:fasciclin domain-containing protein n=1 Tax=Flavobacterium sp. ASW18X TaxID=2572595 RepID=UPI001F107823|nr:fasciclin domain-containing protein [Flavobacterium sp. ASW18X]